MCHQSSKSLFLFVCFSVGEYTAAFGSRPRITRTPDVSLHSSSGRSSRTSISSGSRPTSRGSYAEGPTPQPKFSDSLPSRPNSGGKPSS